MKRALKKLVPRVVCQWLRDETNLDNPKVTHINRCLEWRKDATYVESMSLGVSTV